MKRNTFLQSIVGASALSALPLSCAIDPIVEKQTLENPGYSPTGALIGLKHEPIETVRMGIIGLGNRGQGLTEMMYWMVEHGTAEIVAMSDLDISKCEEAITGLSEFQVNTPTTYCKDEDDWKNLCKRDDLDLILICTPWHLHTPMCIYGMEQGKHVASEVPIAHSLSDCYALVQTAEETNRHCIMIENCCYNDEELFVLNMIQNGVFGDLTHAEGAYLHDLRAHLLSEDYYQGQWRLKEHQARNGNFYTTHGLGPISTYMDIGRGDKFSHLTSMSSRELNLSRTALREGKTIDPVLCGDMNTTLIKTELGKTIMLQFDVHSGSPYSRINKIIGTKAVHQGYPSKVFLDDPNELIFWGHEWLEQEAYDELYAKHKHPMISKLENISKDFKQGHGGMDFVMMYRLITCLNLGLPLDLNVYDGVSWSAITPLTELSVADKSRSVDIPDFTNGGWKTKSVHEIMREMEAPIK